MRAFVKRSEVGCWLTVQVVIQHTAVLVIKQPCSDIKEETEGKKKGRSRLSSQRDCPNYHPEENRIRFFSKLHFRLTSDLHPWATWGKWQHGRIWGRHHLHCRKISTVCITHSLLNLCHCHCHPEGLFARPIGDTSESDGIDWMLSVFWAVLVSHWIFINGKYQTNKNDV